MNCRVPGCDWPVFVKELCTAHYQRERAGNLRPEVPVRRRVKYVSCREDACVDKPVSFGFCQRHYKGHLRHGTLDAVRFTDRTCTVPDCDRTHFGKGLCEAHYHRLLRAGDVREHEPVRDRAESGDGYVTSEGYRIIYREHPNANSVGAIAEHRYVVAVHLGRALVTGEEVHHRNGDRCDNTVGPCVVSNGCDCDTLHNLELWSKSQPAGQRVSDKLKWAREILALYSASGGV